MKEDQKIVIYQTEDGQTQIDVRLEDETVWLTQAQMVELFQTTKQNISLHVGNVFKEGELEQEATVKEYLTVQNEGNRKVARKVKFYNLDVIISVGYRVKSKRGTAFRIWARTIIKDYLVKGYAVNQRIHREQIGELRQLVGMLGRTIQGQPLLSTDETNALFEVVTDYTYALDRIKHLHATEETFEMPKDWTAKEFFDGCFGIIAEQSVKIQPVKLKVSAGQANYIRDLKMHESYRKACCTITSFTPVTEQPYS